MYVYCVIMIALAVISCLAAIGCMIALKAGEYKLSSETKRVLIMLPMFFMCLAVLFARCGLKHSVCSNCGWDYLVISSPEYCGECGDELISDETSKRVCEDCKKTYSGKINFCPECGNALKKAED